MPAKIVAEKEHYRLFGDVSDRSEYGTCWDCLRTWQIMAVFLSFECQSIQKMISYDSSHLFLGGNLVLKFREMAHFHPAYSAYL